MKYVADIKSVGFVALLLSLQLLAGSCSDDKGSTPVTISFGAGDSNQSVSTKAGDNVIYVIVRGDDIPTSVTEVELGQNSVSLTIENGIRDIGVLVYREENIIFDFGEPGGAGGGTTEDVPLFEGEYPGARFFQGEASGVVLGGDPVNLSINVVEETDLVAVGALVTGVNTADAGDTITGFPGLGRIVDVETGFVYPTMFPVGKLGEIAVPNVLVPGRVYDFEFDTGSGPQVLDNFTAVFSTTGEVEIVTPSVPFTPVDVTTETGLQSALAAANSNNAVDVINIVTTSALNIDLNNPLPSLVDDYGLVLRAKGGKVSIDGGLLASGSDGLRIESDNVRLIGIDFFNFPGFGIAIKDVIGGDIVQSTVIHNSDVVANANGGILIDGARFTFVSDGLISGNPFFGVFFTGETAFSILSGNQFVGESTLGTTCVMLDSQVSSISVGDDGMAGGQSTGTPKGNEFSNCFIGVEGKANAEFDVSYNKFGVDDTGAPAPNALAVAVDSAARARIVGNEFYCNGEGTLDTDCGPNASLPSLPTEYTPGGALHISSVVNEIDIRRNIFALGTTGVRIADGLPAGSFSVIEHNTFHSNAIGLDVGMGSTLMQVASNIFAYHDFGSGGILLGPGIAIQSTFSNLLYNFDLTATPIDMDCSDAAGDNDCGLYFENTIDGNLNCNDATSPLYPLCDPAFANITSFTSLDLRLNSTSPAVDAALTTQDDLVQQIGPAYDIGALESH